MPSNNTAAQQFAEAFLTSPIDGTPLRFAGEPQPYVMGMQRVKMVDASGNEWTLTVGLKEGHIPITQMLDNISYAMAETTNKTDVHPHKWDREGERCVKCGDKDWMGGGCSVPD